MVYNIIKEEIQRVLKENYFASRYEKECMETAERIMKKLNYEIYEREQSNEKMVFRIDEYLNLPYKDSNDKYKIDVLVWYDENRPLKKFYGHCYENDDIIDCYVGKDVTFDFIFGTLQHELTHILDAMFIKQKNIKKSYRIQPKNINNKIDEIMYRLWDTSEFNAQQVPVRDNYHNIFVQHIMKLLNDIYYDETIDWKQVGDIIQLYDITKRIKPNTPPEVIKKYFFDTSFKKLKKFIRKTI